MNKVLDFMLSAMIWISAVVFLCVSVYVICDGMIVTRSAVLGEEVLAYAKADDHVDIRGLKEINNDVVGWIRIDGTDIDYPVLQSTDNSYYLSRNVWREFATAGSIFLDYKSS